MSRGTIRGRSGHPQFEIFQDLFQTPRSRGHRNRTWRRFAILCRLHRVKNDMPKDRPRVRPGPVEIGDWIVDGLIVLALCIATAKGHRVAFGFFALFAIVGLATRAHWTAAYVIPNGLRVLTALLYLSSGILLTAAAFDLLSGTATTAARWTFTVACAITLAARMARWRAAALPTDTAA